jgi:hypothetical protein
MSFRLSWQRSVKVALFSPAYRGQIWDRNRATFGRDIAYAIGQGWRVVDLNDGVVNPQSSIEQARNLAISRTHDCEMLLMCDSDVAAAGSPLEALSKQLGQAVAIGAPVLCRHGKTKRPNVCEGRPAAALMLINLRRLRALNKPAHIPWSKRVWTGSYTFARVDEGVYFSAVVQRLGGQVLIAHGVTTYHNSAHVLEHTHTLDKSAEGPVD